MNKLFALFALLSFCSIISAQGDQPPENVVSELTQGQVVDDGNILIGGDTDIPVDIGLNLGNPNELILLGEGALTFEAEIGLGIGLNVEYGENEFGLLLTETILVNAAAGEVEVSGIEGETINFNVEVIPGTL